MNEFERQAVETALRKMFRPEGWLDICVLDKSVQIAKVVPPQQEYRTLSVLHCIHWKEMPAPVRDEAVRVILSWFALPAFDPFAALVPPALAKPRGLFQRLLQ